jgi:uncharacterized phage protein gp47/JayE
MVRNDVTSALSGATLFGNSVLRVMSDAMGALAHLVLRYIDWLSLQLLPDTAETEWLDRHGDIWLINADGSIGRKGATFSSGIFTLTGIQGYIVPIGTLLQGDSNGVQYQTTNQIMLDVAQTEVNVQSLTAGSISNLQTGDTVSFVTPIAGVDTTGLVLTCGGGADQETDDQLRYRILQRIQQPPQGGDANDYVQWALAVSGVTRAWCAPQEMGIGTCTVRFMMDDLRAGNGGFPLPDDVDAVEAYINTVRPVTVKDLFVAGPIPLPVNLHLTFLNLDNAATRGAMISSLQAQFMIRAIPGQTWYRAWDDEAIINANGVVAYDLVASDVVPPSGGYLPVLGDVTYG